MIYVGIDVAKDKHDCSILDSDGEELYPVFSITNNRVGFDKLFELIDGFEPGVSQVKIGLEATGHYSYNILGALSDRSFPTYVINPLHTNFYRKAQTLRLTKTDRVDAKTIAQMLISDNTLKSYSDISGKERDLKSLTRYRYDMIQNRSKLKISISRLVTILFPELSKQFSTIHSSTVYTLLTEFPSASLISKCDILYLSKLLHEASKGHYGEDMAQKIHELALNSVGSDIPAKSLELKHTIKQVQYISKDIDETEKVIDDIMQTMDSPITTIPGIKNRLGAIILAEIGDFSRFDSADKLLAYAGLSPSTYQSGQLVSTRSHMEKRGSKYLRYALFDATRHVCIFSPRFKAYLNTKRAEGKHYNVAISHAAKKLVRTIYRMELTGEAFME